MQRPNYAKLYRPPRGYIPPEEDRLRNDTQNPNFNSIQYRKKLINRTPKILKYFDCFSINNDGLIALGCNELTGRVWDSYVWGCENIQSFGIENNSAFKIHLRSNITNIEFLDTNILVITQAGGAIQLWSTKSSNKSINTYCMFLIGERNEHSGSILALDSIDNNYKVITGCSQRLLKIWDVGKADIYSIHSMHNAHSDSITSVSSNKTSDSVFSSCSLDRSALIWDIRQARPATSLFENHDIDFTSIKWGCLNESDNEMIYLGDAAGDLHILDPKMPNKFIDTLQVHTRPISKIRPSGTKMAVVGETNLIRVYENKSEESKNNNTPIKYECIYKDSSATNTVRDALWNPLNLNELLTIGWDSKLNRHIIS